MSASAARCRASPDQAATGRSPALRQMHSARAVGILAGMGPAAGADFARQFVTACEAWLRAHDRCVNDQAFPEHWMVQLPVPDRSAALADARGPQPLEPLARGLAQLAGLGVQVAAIPCNTAHAWHAALQARVPQVELLHMPRETAAELRRRGVARVGLLATQGTYRQGLYSDAFAEAGIACALPDEAGQAQLMRGIYEGVKAGDLPLAQTCFVAVGEQLRALHGDIPLVMACTEIPLAMPHAARTRAWPLIDPCSALAATLADRALGADSGHAEQGPRCMALA